AGLRRVRGRRARRRSVSRSPERRRAAGGDEPRVRRRARARASPARHPAGSGIRAARDLRRGGDGPGRQPARRATCTLRTRICLRVSRPGFRARVYNSSLTFRELPLSARIHISAVMCAGVAACIWSVRAGAFDRPWILVLLALTSIAAHTLKIDLPLSTSSSTLSTGYAVGFASLLLFGVGPALWMMVSGAWAQCTLNTKGHTR